MKYISIALCILFLNGCAIFSSKRSREQAEYYKQQEEQARLEANELWDKRQARKKTLAPEMSHSKFLSIWGEPDSKEYMSGITIYWYDDQTEPMFIYFKNKKLIGWKIDKQTLAQRKQETIENEIKEQQRDLAIQRKNQEQRQMWGAALESYGNSLQKQSQPQYIPNNNVNCTSNTLSGTTYTNCH